MEFVGIYKELETLIKSLKEQTLSNLSHALIDTANTALQVRFQLAVERTPKKPKHMPLTIPRQPPKSAKQRRHKRYQEQLATYDAKSTKQIQENETYESQRSAFDKDFLAPAAEELIFYMLEILEATSSEAILRMTTSEEQREGIISFSEGLLSVLRQQLASEFTEKRTVAKTLAFLKQKYRSVSEDFRDHLGIDGFIFIAEDQQITVTPPAGMALGANSAAHVGSEDETESASEQDEDEDSASSESASDTNPLAGVFTTVDARHVTVEIVHPSDDEDSESEKAKDLDEALARLAQPENRKDLKKLLNQCVNKWQQFLNNQLERKLFSKAIRHKEQSYVAQVAFETLASQSSGIHGSDLLLDKESIVKQRKEARILYGIDHNYMGVHRFSLTGETHQGDDAFNTKWRTLYSEVSPLFKSNYEQYSLEHRQKNIKLFSAIPVNVGQYQAEKYHQVADKIFLRKVSGKNRTNIIDNEALTLFYQKFWLQQLQAMQQKGVEIALLTPIGSDKHINIRNGDANAHTQYDIIAAEALLSVLENFQFDFKNIFIMPVDQSKAAIERARIYANFPNDNMSENNVLPLLDKDTLDVACAAIDVGYQVGILNVTDDCLNGGKWENSKLSPLSYSEQLARRTTMLLSQNVAYHPSLLGRERVEFVDRKKANFRGTDKDFERFTEAFFPEENALNLVVEQHNSHDNSRNDANYLSALISAWRKMKERLAVEEENKAVVNISGTTDEGTKERQSEASEASEASSREATDSEATSSDEGSELSEDGDSFAESPRKCARDILQQITNEIFSENARQHNRYFSMWRNFFKPKLQQFIDSINYAEKPRKITAPKHALKMFEIVKIAMAKADNKPNLQTLAWYDETSNYSFESALEEWEHTAQRARSRKSFFRTEKTNIFYENQSNTRLLLMSKEYCQTIKQEINDATLWQEANIQSKLTDAKKIKKLKLKNLKLSVDTNKKQTTVKVPEFIVRILNSIDDAEKSKKTWRESATAIHKELLAATDAANGLGRLEANVKIWKERFTTKNATVESQTNLRSKQKEADIARLCTKIQGLIKAQSQWAKGPKPFCGLFRPSYEKKTFMLSTEKGSAEKQSLTVPEPVANMVDAINKAVTGKDDYEYRDALYVIRSVVEKNKNGRDAQFYQACASHLPAAMIGVEAAPTL